MHTEPAADPGAVALLRDAAREALALGDAAGGAALLSRALDEPPDGERAAVVFELGGNLFYAGRAAEGAAILRRAQERLPAEEPLREELEVALLGVSYTSAS